tara:strand:- start:105 stop:788 length:684 start_codon:yes stop_codon:yes gene_type:complete
MNKIFYGGWELQYFDKASNFRNYQFDLVKRFIKGNVAEVGPGNGVFLKYYLPLADTIDLFEPSENFLINLNKFKDTKVNIINSYFKENKNYYDTILYLDVLEHIKDDQSEVQAAYESLKKGGALIINVPAFQHLYSKFDKDIEHLRRYSKNTLNSLTTKLSFSQTNLFYYDSIGYLLSFASKLITKDYLNNFDKKIKIWDSLIPFSKLIDLLTLNKFGKSLIMICIK